MIIHSVSLRRHCISLGAHACNAECPTRTTLASPGGSREIPYKWRFNEKLMGSSKKKRETPEDTKEYHLWPVKMPPFARFPRAPKRTGSTSAWHEVAWWCCWAVGDNFPQTSLKPMTRHDHSWPRCSQQNSSCLAKLEPQMAAEHIELWQPVRVVRRVHSSKPNLCVQKAFVKLLIPSPHHYDIQ